MIVVDTHLHYYDFYDAALFVKSLMLNLDRIAPGADRAGVVLDRAGLEGFGLLGKSLNVIEGAEVSVSEECISYKDGCGSVEIYRGVQVACAEGFEVLGLFCSEELEDRIPAVEAIKRITDAGGIPLIAWAPGKWLLKRRELVGDLLKKVDAELVCIGDTALRPTFWGEPELMGAFRSRGGKVLCGSDPLPFSGQETVSGSFATALAGDAKGGSLRDMLTSKSANVSSAGRRAGCVSFFARMLRNRLAS